MKERQIPFSAPMVLALLDERKTQTRRIVKHEPALHPNRTAWDFTGCPYGQPGDRLWVREAWRTDKEYDPCSPAQIDSGASLLMLADNCEYRINRRPECGTVEWGRYRHARFMPRRFSRILLEITNVRVERLQDISEEDAIAEGVWHGDWEYDNGECCESAKEAYGCLWESLNGSGSWDANPWVWVISFRRVKP